MLQRRLVTKATAAAAATLPLTLTTLPSRHRQITRIAGAAVTPRLPALLPTATPPHRQRPTLRGILRAVAAVAAVTATEAVAIGVVTPSPPLSRRLAMTTLTATIPIHLAGAAAQ